MRSFRRVTAFRNDQSVEQTFGERRFSLAVSVLFGLSLMVAGLIHAERPPLEEEELVSGSDLIVDVDVMSVAKVGRPGAPVWLARFKIRKVIKGESPPSPMDYWFLPPEPGLAGGRNESVFAGQHLKLYLVRDSGGEFVPWASNSIELLDHFNEDRYVLPKQFGEVIDSDGKRHTQPTPRSGCVLQSSSTIVPETVMPQCSVRRHGSGGRILRCR